MMNRKYLKISLNVYQVGFFYFVGIVSEYFCFIITISELRGSN